MDIFLQQKTHTSMPGTLNSTIPTAVAYPLVGTVTASVRPPRGGTLPRPLLGVSLIGIVAGLRQAATEGADGVFAGTAGFLSPSSRTCSDQSVSQSDLGVDGGERGLPAVAAGLLDPLDGPVISIFSHSGRLRCMWQVDASRWATGWGKHCGGRCK